MIRIILPDAQIISCTPESPDTLEAQAQASKAIFMYEEPGGRAASAFQKVAARSSH